VHGLQRIQEVSRVYIERHRETTAKKHRAALTPYLEAAKALAQVVHELVVIQGKLAEWVGAEELRKIIVTTFDRLPDRLAELDRPRDAGGGGHHGEDRLTLRSSRGGSYSSDRAAYPTPGRGPRSQEG
jgi:hypothetical protein